MATSDDREASALKVLITGADKKLAEKIYDTYINEGDDYSKFPLFMKELDRLIMSHGGKPASEEDEEELEEDDLDDIDESKDEDSDESDADLENFVEEDAGYNEAAKRIVKEISSAEDAALVGKMRELAKK